MNRIGTTAILFLFLGVALSPISTGSQLNKNTMIQKENITPSSKTTEDTPTMTPEDEGDHFPCGCEWWWLYTMCTLEDGSEWDICIQFLYQMNWTKTQWSSTDGVSYLRIQSWDRHTGDLFTSMHINTHPRSFHHEKEKVNLTYYDSTMTGVYPNYTAFIHDDTNNISMTVEITATAAPYLAGTESVGGVIPWGTGSFQYWTLPLVTLYGTLTKKNVSSSVTGIGYMEHFFGDAHLFDTFLRTKSLRDLLQLYSLYSSFEKWILKENLKNGLISLNSLDTSTDNFVGYDWIWTGFDNGWSMILYRLSAFTVNDGQSLGVIVISDGNSSWEFGDLYIKVLREAYLKERDMYLPMDFEIIARKDAKEFHVVFNSTTNVTTMYFKKGFFEFGNFLVAGEAHGYFKDNDTLIPLTGKGTNTPLRYIPRFIKHISSNIELILPPKGMGIFLQKVTHYFGIKISFKLLLRPIFTLSFSITPSPS
ncbi:MAG: hypothetical protein NT038_10090 [Euryarchaeota archaeon]|nr:hypothetical protein [Euryarchaeota archaeon]